MDTEDLIISLFLQETVSVQVAFGSQRSPPKLGASRGGVAGRVREVLLPEDRQRQGRLRRRQRQEGAAEEAGLQELQVVPGQHLSGAVHTRRSRGQRRGEICRGRVSFVICL